MEIIKGSRILVTGAAGFVGSHVTEHLARLGARVIAFYRSQDPNSYFFRSRLERSVMLALGDLKDANRVFDVVTKYQVQYVVHLGAQAIVPTAYENPLETMASNVMGTVHVLEAARRSRTVKGVIVASSDKAYGKSKKAYQETDALRGDHPYDVSKSSADLIANAYIKTYGQPVVITRFGNIYGPGDNNFSRIVPGIMQSAIKGTKLLLRSDGTFVRDYVYVADVADAYIFLLKHFEKAKGRAYNISSGQSASVLALIRRAETAIKRRIRYEIINSAKNEIPFQSLDYSLIKELGWKPKTNLATGLRQTYLWYKKNPSVLE